jgi:hypothetical protein
MAEILQIFSKKGRVKRFVCLTPSGRGNVVIRNRFYMGFERENRICRKRVPQKSKEVSLF